MSTRFKNIDTLGVSVVIVTYNGAQRILPTLRHLSEQKNSACNWEVLVIDNNSTDDTVKVINEFWGSKNGLCPLRIVKESKPGTMHARYRGMIESNYRYMLYCDDDNWFHDTYVSKAFKLISKDAHIAAVGGKGIIEYDASLSLPAWMCEEYERSFGTGSQDINDGDLTNKKGSLYTAGAIFDRVWLNRLYAHGFYSVLKGRDGKSLVAGEDTELTFALRCIGGRLHYSSELHFKHFMPASRINWDYLKRLWKAFGFSSYIISAYNFQNQEKKHHYFIDLFHQIKKMLLLYLKKIKGNFKEGDKELLLIGLHLGCIKAMIFQHKKFKEARKMAIKLAKVKR